MLSAACMGATAFQKGLGGIHALAHPIGAYYNLHHGLINGVLLPYVLKRNEQAISDKIAELSYQLKISPNDFSAFMKWVLKFRKVLKIPETLKKLKIGAQDDKDFENNIDKIAADAEIDPSNDSNPSPLTANDYKQILINAINGEL